jgi:hypothetical protein
MFEAIDYTEGFPHQTIIRSEFYGYVPSSSGAEAKTINLVHVSFLLYVKSA